MQDKNEKRVIYVGGVHDLTVSHLQCPACQKNGAGSSSLWEKAVKLSKQRSYSVERGVGLVIATAILLSSLLFGVAVGVSLQWMLYGLAALFLTR